MKPSVAQLIFPETILFSIPRTTSISCRIEETVVTICICLTRSRGYRCPPPKSFEKMASPSISLLKWFAHVCQLVEDFWRPLQGFRPEKPSRLLHRVTMAGSPLLKQPLCELCQVQLLPPPLPGGPQLPEWPRSLSPKEGWRGPGGWRTWTRIPCLPQSVHSEGGARGVWARLVRGQPFHAVPPLSHRCDPKHLAQRLKVLPGDKTLVHWVQLMEEVPDVLFQVGRELDTGWAVSYVGGRSAAVQVAEMSADG